MDTPDEVIDPEVIVPPPPPPVDEQAFHDLVQKRGAKLLEVALYVERCAMQETVMTRPLLGILLAESAQLVELLDAYGCRNNCQWHNFRHLVAALKLYARLGYTLLHLHHSIDLYRLLPVEGDIHSAARDALCFCGTILEQLSCRLHTEAKMLSIDTPDHKLKTEDFKEDLPPGRLPNDRNRRRVISAEETATHLATAFLNTAVDGDILALAARARRLEHRDYIPDPLCESSVRNLELRFHNLQSLYDTFISDTDTESLDEDLPTLRGHISMIFHLMEAATQMIHYYERHMDENSATAESLLSSLVNPDVLLETLYEYSLRYASRYLKSAQSLCQGMLKRYAKIGRIDVPVPRYRGFHVRPSTLVAKIVGHYGSEVRMEMMGEEYDASYPLDLFRANEHINAAKRRKLAEEISHMNVAIPASVQNDFMDAILQVILNLAAAGKIVLYERPVQLPDMTPTEGAPLTQFALDEIQRLLATGKIDIEADICVTFIGDERVLKDLRCLAEHGYGEDDFGNNIALPKALSYLRR